MTIQRFLSCLFLIILVNSCTRQAALLPLSANTEYINDHLTAIEQNKDLRLQIHFEKKTKNYLIYQVSIDNLSDQTLDVLPSNFYYTINNSTTKFRAIEHHALIQKIDNNIVNGETTDEVIGYIKLANAITDLVTTATEDDKNISKEASLQKELDQEQKKNILQESKQINSEETIRLYQLKEQLNQFYLTPASLNVGQSYSGIIYLPLAKNSIKEIFNITYAYNKETINIPFGQKKQ